RILIRVRLADWPGKISRSRGATTPRQWLTARKDCGWAKPNGYHAHAAPLPTPTPVCHSWHDSLPRRVPLPAHPECLPVRNGARTGSASNRGGLLAVHGATRTREARPVLSHPPRAARPAIAKRARPVEGGPSRSAGGRPAVFRS